MNSKNTFFIKPTESTLYNTLPINSKTNEVSKNKVVLNEPNNKAIKKKERNKETIRERISCKTNIKESETNSKSHIETQQTLFNFDYD